MKNVLGSFKSIEFNVNGVEFLNESEMQNIRGGADEKPISRPRDVLDWEEV